MSAKFTDIASFVSVVDHGSISAAARANGVPKSTISRRVTRLEAALGVALVTRSSQRIAITNEGRQFHARASGALAELREAELQLRESQQDPSGALVITAPHDIARSTAFTALLERYHRSCPQVTIDARLETRYVDLVREGVDVAIRAHNRNVPGDPELRSKVVNTALLGFYASPEYLRSRPAPSSLEDLEQHDLLLHSTTQSSGSTLSNDQLSLKFTAASAAVTSNDFGLLQSMAARGCGIALLPILWVRDPSRPQLSRVLPQWSGQQGRLSVVWAHRRYMPAKLRRFIDLAVETLGSQC